MRVSFAGGGLLGGGTMRWRWVQGDANALTLTHTLEASALTSSS